MEYDKDNWMYSKTRNIENSSLNYMLSKNIYYEFISTMKPIRNCYASNFFNNDSLSLIRLRWNIIYNY
jgi:hypothetical protein